MADKLKDALTNRWIETIPKEEGTSNMANSQRFQRQSTGARYNQDTGNKRSIGNKWSKLGDVGEVKGKKILSSEGKDTGKISRNQHGGGGKSGALTSYMHRRQGKEIIRSLNTDAINALKSILSKTEGNAGEPSHKKQTRRPEGDTAENYDNREYTNHANLSKKKKKYPALTDRQNQIMEDIKNEGDSGNQYYSKALKVLLEKDDKADKLGKEATDSAKDLINELNNIKEHGTKEDNYRMGDLLEDVWEIPPISRGVEAIQSGHHDTRFRGRKSRNALRTYVEPRIAPPPRIATSGYKETIEPDKKRSWSHTIANENKAWRILLEKNSGVDKIITDLARKIKDPEKREDIIQRQAEQKVKETIKAWRLLFKGRFDDANSRMINTLRSRGINARLSKKPCVHCGEGEKLVEMQDDKGNWSTSNINAMHHTTSTANTGVPNTHEGEICPDCDKKQISNEYGKKLGVKEFQEANKAWEVLFKGRRPKIIIPEGSTYKEQVEAKDKKGKKHKLISPKQKKPVDTGAKGDKTMEVIGRKGDAFIPTKGKILGHPRSERVYQEGKWSKAFRGDNSKQTGKKIRSGIRALKLSLKNRNP